ncbi:hypothetical protein [Saccharopolyspora flava]|uniref:Cell division protein FtsI (Penicillin-binding protein 3) n=1 Tax=Saccharopolyspora flava TaxID=95161 RepID=A0A1I6P1A7_9PSEU|nr:hypothetical protein [Saccharopolyspora flava]SFS33967.1 cell division protein FtsI (penicillin-binding protein 3) [Saccharopolyspora flava]
MTAPARANAASRTEAQTAEKTRTTQPSGLKSSPKKSDKRRTRSAAAERAYARREERRDQSVRRPRQIRQGAEERRPVAAMPRARQLVHDRVSTLARLPLVVVVMVVLATGLAATLWLSISAVSGSYRLQEGETRLNVLNERKEQLQRDVSTMGSTPEIQRRAEQELGMVKAPAPAHLVPQPDGSVVVVGEPEKAVAPPPPAPPAPPVVPGQPVPGQPTPGQPAPQQAGAPGQAGAPAAPAQPAPQQDPAAAQAMGR